MGIEVPERTEGIAEERLTAAMEVRPWLEAVAQISAAVNNMEPVTNVLNAIAATTCGLLGYDFGAVLLADRERLYMRGSHGLPQSYIEAINTEKPIRLGHGPFGEGPSSRAFRSHRPVVVRDYTEDASVGPWAGVASEHGFRSLATVPLVVSGRAIGTLNCYTRTVRDWSSEELLLLSTIANQAALAIETARLREHERATIARLETARQSLQEQASMLERSEEIHAQLTRAVLDDAGLTAIAQALTRILRGSVVIHDAGQLTLATAAFGNVPATVSPGLLRDRSFAERLAARLGPRKPIELTSEDHRTIEMRTFVAPIVIDRVIVGRLWVLGAETPLEALERRALEHGATVVALELLKQRIASEVEGRLAGELLDDLFSGRAIDQQTARVRAGHLGHDLSPRQAAIVASLDPAPGEKRAPADRPSRHRQLVTLGTVVVRRLHADGLVGEVNDHVVMLISESAKRDSELPLEVADALRRDVKAYYPGTTASIAFGPWEAEVPGYARSYRIARGALAISQRFGGSDRTISADRLGVHGLLLSVERLDELVRFAESTLQPLRTYDERRSSELLSTLAAYLSHGCRPGETAEALIVHPNTVAYRVRRIESLLGLDLGKPDAQLQVQLALIVDDIKSGAHASTG